MHGQQNIKEVQTTLYVLYTKPTIESCIYERQSNETLNIYLLYYS